MCMDVPAALLQNFKLQLTGLYSNLLIAPCLLCGQSCKNSQLCDACLADLPLLGNSCPQCANPSRDAVLCGRCLHQAPERDVSVCLYNYHPPVDRLIADLKFNDKVFLSRFFAEQLAQKVINREKSLPQLLIPIPLHPRRLRERGYNQAKELAHHLSQLCNVPLNSSALLRTRDTAPQASLSFTQRQKNIQRAFKVNDSILPKHIALIDDVLTTGHTADIAAKTLRQAGVEKIELWTIARTIRHD